MVPPENNTNLKFTILLTNSSYSDDIRYSKVFDRVPTRQDVEDEFRFIGPGDFREQTYTVIDNESGEWGSITCGYSYEHSSGCLQEGDGYTESVPWDK